MNISIKPIAYDIETVSWPRPEVPASDYEARARALHDAARADWVVVYGDREHAANIAFVCGFDPRFEEAALVLGPSNKRALIVGNEGLGYAFTLRLPVEVVLCQSFSLMGQPRNTSPRIADVLRGIGISAGASVGVAGWKYLEAEEGDDPVAPAFVPAFLVAAIEHVIGQRGELHDVTSALMHPVNGLKSRNSAAQIAAFAWSAARASAGVMRVVRGAQPGMTEYECASLARYEGEPMSCHLMMNSASADAPVVGLRSPSSRVMAWGDGVSVAIGLQGGLCARAGLLRDTPDAGFVEAYVVPYYCAVATWWMTMRIGVTGGEVNNAVMNALAGTAIRPLLNPGHLGSIDEWTHTPIRPGSTDMIASGMVFQCDIIPTPMRDGQALNCEDTVAVADAQLRAEIRAGHPELWQFIESRRVSMREALGLVLAEDLLPLSVAPAYMPPFWLASDLACVLEEE